MHLLTLVGNFDAERFRVVEGINHVGTKVCSFHIVGATCNGWVLQHVDAGLAIISMLSTQVHRRMLEVAVSPLPRWPPAIKSEMALQSGDFSQDAAPARDSQDHRPEQALLEEVQEQVLLEEVPAELPVKASDTAQPATDPKNTESNGYHS